MSTGKAYSWSGAVLLLALVALGVAGCGGGSSNTGSDGKDLWVSRFSVPNFSGILLDESVSIEFSANVKAKSLNHDSVQFRTGAQGGQAPRGSFVRGSFLFDPDSGTRVVIDPDPIGDQQINEIQKTGKLELVPDEIRYDLGFSSDLNGSRMVLMDKSRKTTVTFVPEVPTRLDLSDTGYAAGATYTLVVPAYPETNTVKSTEGSPVVERDGRTFVSSFTTVPTTSPFLFLGGENAGAPRVINSSPADSQSGVEIDTKILVRFSQPIAPWTVTPDNFFLNIVSIPGRPQLEVSLFLRQSRTGLVEVVMTPLLNLPANEWFEVTVGQGVRDLLGAPVPPQTKFSFSTSGENPPPTDIVEQFANNSQEEENITSANWNGTKPYVGATPGALVAAYSPFAGSGADGAFSPTVGDVTILDTGTQSHRQFNYTEIDVSIGAVVIGDGDYGLVLRSQGDVSISGEISVSGFAGGTGQTGSPGGGDPTGGVGGLGGPGGFDGGDGAMATNDEPDGGSLGNFDGLDGDGTGGGNGGETGDQEETPTADNQPANPARMREAGGGGGHANQGGDSDYANFKGNDGGRGGDSYGEADFSDAPLIPSIVGVPTLTQGFGGGGGGGGGGEDDHPQPTSSGQLGDGKPGPEDEGGGGGGGGGGALQITAYGDVDIAGRISANGGIGGSSFNEDTGGLGQGAAGGGGAGGAVWIQSFGEMTLDALAVIEAIGGEGGLGDSITNRAGLDKQNGGEGADGYIRLEDSDGSIIVPSTVVPQTSDTVGTFSPRLSLNSYAQSRWYNQYFPTPDYGVADIDSDLNNGGILVEVQGAREDVNSPGTGPVDPDLDPERLNSTDWVPVSEIDQLDNFQYLRFRVFFNVDPLQDFSDPLPVIRQITIPVNAGS